MKILFVHNFYQQPGGEDGVFSAEKALLSNRGHEVWEYTDHNDRLSEIGRLAALRDTLWSNHTRNKLERLIAEFKPDVVHCHNIFPLISPSVYYVCTAQGIPVVQTLHNYRLLCPNALFFRDGIICEECLGKNPSYPGIVHSCYRNSRVQTAAVSLMLSTHRFLKTWQKKVTLYIALTKFSRQKFIAGGLPANRIVVKPNFIEDPCSTEVYSSINRRGALFVGRLSAEKGIDTMLKAFQKLQEIPLTIVGDGPLKEKVIQASKQSSNIHYAGQLTKDEVLMLMGRSSFLVFPSQWYEGFPMTLVEAFACGLPVVASGLGAMAEIVSDGKTGLHFIPGDVEDMAERVRWAVLNQERLAEMGKNARHEYELKYTGERNYRILMNIYKKAIKMNRTSKSNYD